MEQDNKNSKIEPAIDLSILNKKDKEISKLKSQVEELKEMLKLQKEQMTNQFEKEKQFLLKTNDFKENHVFYKGIKYDIVHTNVCKWISDDCKKKFVDENYLALVIPKYE